METDIDYINSNPLHSQPSPLSPNPPHPSPPPEPKSGSVGPGPGSPGLDPLFSEGDQSGVKRVLDFSDLELGDASSPPHNDLFVDQTVTKKKRSIRGSGSVSDPKPKCSKRQEKMEQKARTEQLADFQRVMRERKGVGFKPLPMIEKPISSVLQKIRQRKLELSKKTMASRTIQRADSSVSVMVDDDSKEHDNVFEISDPRNGKTVPKMAVDEPAFVDISPCASPEKAKVDDKPQSSNELTSTRMPLREETTQPFHPPVNDTQDLFSDSQTSDTQEDQSNEKPSSPTEDIAPSLPSLNLKFDSAPPDDISSDEEETDNENKDPDPLLFKRKPSPRGDPVKDFVDEEALEDSDDELLKFHDEDEDEDADMEEVQDYIATDFQEKAVDRERRNELHQLWLQQQDEAGTENLLQKLKYGTEQKEPSLLDNEDDGRSEDEELEDDDEDDTEDLHLSTSTRLSTKKLKQMIPQMFTDKDDGYVSSEDEDSQEILSKERILQNLELKEKSKFISPAEDETSREVLNRIRKLNVVPETNKRQKSTSCLDSLLMKGGKNNSSKSSFLRRASSQPMASSHRQGPSTVRGFIFGRDDSNSRSSVSLPEDSSDVPQIEGKVKRSSSARFISSQSKSSTKRTEITRTETVSGASLFEILNRSSVKMGCDLEDRDNLMNDHVVFAAFKSVRKLTKIERK